MAFRRKRIIDSLPPVTERPVEMQVLGLGMSRTATMSLYHALPKLGYRSYHANEMHQSPVQPAYVMWKEGMNAKYFGHGKPYGKEEFEKLLKDYSAVTDIPCILFVDELVAAYPDAKVVLTIRDPDKWLQSMEKTFYKFTNWHWDWLAPFDPMAIGSLWWIIKSALIIWTSNDINNRSALRQGYLDHYAHVRAVVPKENLLEFRSEEGWEPLCKFLGKEVPAEPYPHINDADSVVKLMAWTYNMLVIRAAQNVAKNVAIYVLPAGIVAVAVWYAFYVQK